MKRIRMRSVKTALVAFGAALAGLMVPSVGARAFQANQEQTTPTDFRAVTEAVLLDIVVRDKDGRPITDLKPEEVEVYDNGVRQELISFQYHGQSGIDVTPVGEGAAGGSPDQIETRIEGEHGDLRMANLVTLVFDNLDTESAALARRAAETFVDQYAGPNIWIAVFNISRRLIILQEFSQDVDLLKQAVSEATSQSPIQYYNKSSEIYAKMAEIRDLEETAEVQATAGGSAAGLSGPTTAQARMAQMIVNMMQFAQGADLDQSGRSTIYSLLSLVQGQGALEGRKTLVFYSEGLVITANLEGLFKSLRSEANRNNVSIYSVDARGLRSGSDLEWARGALTDAVETSRRQQQKTSGGVTREEAMLVDRQDEIGRLNVQAALGDLALSTGGLLIANTNDLAPGMERISQDIYSHYELAYTPRQMVYDGSFRPIEVKITRANAQVQSRDGYFAFPPTGGLTLLPFEREMLSALASGSLSNPLELRADLIRFAPRGVRSRHKLILEMPLKDVAFRDNKQEKQYEAEVALMAVIKDEGGKVIEKFSQSYPVRGPLKNKEAVQLSNVVFIREVALRPGKYTLESVGHDQGGAQFSAQRLPLEVPALDPGVKLSSIVVVKRTEEVPEQQPDPADPLQFQNLKLTPSLGEPIVKTAGNKVVLYIVVYPDKALEYAPKLGLEFSQSGQVIGATQPQLPDRDANGNIPFVITFPLDYFNPGDYKVRAVAQQGNSWTESSAEFSIVAPK